MKKSGGEKKTHGLKKKNQDQPQLSSSFRIMVSGLKGAWIYCRTKLENKKSWVLKVAESRNIFERQSISADFSTRDILFTKVVLTLASRIVNSKESSAGRMDLLV